MTLAWLRDLVDNSAAGNEGLERLSLELRLHALTWANWNDARKREALAAFERAAIERASQTGTPSLYIERTYQAARRELLQHMGLDS